MANKRRELEVKIPAPADERPRWGRIGIFAAVGLVAGIAWPTLAGVRVGPDLPGGKEVEGEVAPPPPASAPNPAASVPLASSAAPAASGKAQSNEQTVVVGGGEIAGCSDGKDKLESEQCGTVNLDATLAPRLEQLKGCPSALGLAGEMEIGFDLRFDTKEIRVLKGKKTELPNSTVQGILVCAADYIRDVQPEKIPHKHARYRVFYNLKFYPPGAAPSAQGVQEEERAEGDGGERGLAAVSWDSALVRSEPRTGEVVSRLVRGTRVKLLGRRKDWYHIKIGDKEGWVYRGALGL
jgi:hypothetical protein